MRLLLDTHAFLWRLAGDRTLSAPAQATIADRGNDIFVSAASTWEIATRHRLGKLPGVVAIVTDLDAVVASQSFIALPVSIRHGQTGGTLPGPHCDPFDRTLIAQAVVDRLVLISNEKIFDTYGIERLW